MRLLPTRPSRTRRPDATPTRVRGRFPAKILAVIVAGVCLQFAVEAAEAAVEEDWDVEVIDLRSLSPFKRTVDCV